MNIRGLSLVVCLGAFCGAALCQQYTITTIAGNGTAGFGGDNGDPTVAQLNSPIGLAVDSQGNLYIADSANHRVRKISGGTITTVAGSSTVGYSGDKAAATSAYLNTPSGLAFDSSGNLYIADSLNNVIRKVASGTITTVAGNQSQGPGLAGGDGGAATSANLNNPTGVFVDSAGNFYIADNGNSVIRKVDVSSGNITAYLGSAFTQGRLNHPNALALSGNALYISDSNNNRIARYAPYTANNVATDLTNFAGNGNAGYAGDGNLAKLAQLKNPVGIAVDSAGSVYIADSNNSRIRKVAPDGTITTIAGKAVSGYSGDSGDATAAALNFPRGIAVAANGTVYIADTSNHVIRALTPSFPAIGLPNGVVNAASFAARLSGGALASVFGVGFGLSTVQPGLPLPISAAGVSVTVNGVAAPILYLAPSQINFQVPWATPSTGSVDVIVSVNGGNSNAVSVPVSTAAPGLFSLGGAAIVQNSPDSSLNTATNPARAGSTIVAYLTGSGPVSPAVADGVATPTDPGKLVIATSVTSAKIGPAEATVSFTGLAPSFVGLTQMNILVPATLAPGIYPLNITIDGQAANSATIAVK